MNILYAVQGTGNGHLSRAMAMAEAFRDHPSLQLTWLLSGRPAGREYGLITRYQWYEGLTLVTHQGRLDPWATFRKNSLQRFYRDIRTLDLSSYDCLISDFEPVLCHAARRQGRDVIGISHQCAFDYPEVPRCGDHWLSRQVMRRFAPVSQSVGLHWDSFGQPLLPPILHLDTRQNSPLRPRQVLVYLPMEDPGTVLACLRPLVDYDWVFYHPDLSEAREGHIQMRAPSITGFKEDLKASRYVLCNTGFELISECLALGKAVLTRPLQGQMEQLSNALALEQLGYATVLEQLSSAGIQSWLESVPQAAQLAFPDTASALAAWIADGCKDSVETLSQRLWQTPQTRVQRETEATVASQGA